MLCRNLHTDWGDGNEPHRTAFMIGRIAGLVPSTETPNRWLITFDQYGIIDKPEAWGKWRNPIHYTTLEALGIRLEDVKFKPMPRKIEKTESVAPSNGTAAKMDIPAAKKALAAYYGVRPEAIEITIRG